MKASSSRLLLCAAFVATAACSSSSASNFTDDSGVAPGAEAGLDAAGDGSLGSDAGSGDAAASPDAPTGVDASPSPEASSGAEGGANDGGGTDDAAAADGGPAIDCGSTPTLHPDPAGTVYCGYGDAGAIDCLTGTQCCLGGALGNGTFAPETCAAYGSTCTNGGDPDAGGSLAIPIACAQIADCTANGVTGAAACCLQGATSPSVNPGCTYPRPKGGTAVVCETGATSPGTCAAGEIQVCSSSADCPTGTVCTAGKWKIYQLGFCL